MSDPTLIYLEADDEITTVVRRLRAADPGPVVIVAPGRSRATSSAVALRLLARRAEAEGRRIAIVGDSLTRSLATEAGVASHSSVEDAVSGAVSDGGTAPPAQTAAIHVVRGVDAAEGAGTGAAVTDPREADTVVVPVARSHPDASGGEPSHGRPSRGPASRGPESRDPASHGQPPLPRRRRPPPPSRRPGRPGGRRSMVAGGVVLAMVLAAWAVIAAMVLPAATIVITPRSEAVGPVADMVSVSDPESLAGTVSESVTVTATGSYETNTAAVGEVTFYNWNFFAVEVPAGSFVAAGEQAFATDEDVVVPAGSFDPFGGGITAGEASVTVTAAAPGPAGNVAAEAIDTVVDAGLAAQLRGFPTITERLVNNAAPTTGGETAAGPEFTQQDVDAAVAELKAALDAAVAEALAESGDAVFVDPGPAPEPQISGLDDLVGKRDSPSARIDGSLAYHRLVADPAEIKERAAERFAVNRSVVPDGWQLDPAATSVEIGTPRLEGTALVVPVEVSGRRVTVIERADVLDRVIGLSASDAQGALSDLGSATVELWPAWVSTVPDSDWRIDLQVAGS